LFVGDLFKFDHFSSQVDKDARSDTEDDDATDEDETSKQILKPGRGDNIPSKIINNGSRKN
jgi:hypothetical protein